MNTYRAAIRAGRGTRPFLTIAVIVFLASACSVDRSRISDPVPPASLGVHVTPRGGPDLDPLWIEAYQSVEQGAFAAAQFDVGWGEVEPYLGVIDWSPVEAHAVQARQRGIPLSCVLTLIDNQLGQEFFPNLPLDLMGRPWDDGSMRIRLAFFARALEERLRPQLAYLWLGREVDAYFEDNLGEIRPFLRLVAECRDSLAVTAPCVKVGVILSFGEAVEEGRLAICDSLASGLDWIGLTVYGRDENYVQTLDPQGTILRAREALDHFASKRVVLSEVGFPGRPGSEEDQDAFARSLITLLRERPQQLQGAFWYCLHDWSPPAARAEARRKYLGEPVREENYRLQLLRLGLIDGSGVAKPAWRTLRDRNRSVAQEVPSRQEVGIAPLGRIVQ